MSLKISVTQKKPGIIVVTPEGSIDTETYASLEKEIDAVLESVPKTIVFDMEKVDYISSMGLGLLFRIKAALEEKGSSLVMVHLPPQIGKVFDVVKFIPTNIFTNMKKADDYLDAFFREIEKNDQES